MTGTDPPQSTLSRSLEGRLTVLCVDENRALAETLAAKLASTDDRIDGVVATDARTALNRLDDVDCVVSDYQMPGHGRP